MKLRKKPVIIDGEQFVIYSKDDNRLSFTAHGITYPVYADDKGPYIIIPTLEGNMRADNLDWILKGVNSECYPCKPDILDKTYDKL